MVERKRLILFYMSLELGVWSFNFSLASLLLYVVYVEKKEKKKRKLRGDEII